MIKKILSVLLVLTVLMGTACSAQTNAQNDTPQQAGSENDTDSPTEEQNDTDSQTGEPEEALAEALEYYTFELSDTVERTHISYENRYGITLKADLYISKDLDQTVKHPALVIGPPYGGVKEQGPGVYANQLAQRGFVVLAFDPSYNGYSEGEPRHVSSPDIFVEDFSAGVDYLGTHALVDREKIGAIGICGSGGFAITAAQVDTRIKAVATVSMYDISRNIRNGFEDSMTDEQRSELLDQLSQQRWEDFESGEPEFIPSFPTEAQDSLPEGLDPISEEFYGYYGLERGHHPNARGGFTTTSMLSFMNFPLLDYIDTISPRPILFIIGEDAHSRYFSEDAYELAVEPKELYTVSEADHVALYDQVDKIPFDKLESFFFEAFQSLE